MNITRVHDTEHKAILLNTGLGEKLKTTPPEAATIVIAKGQNHSYVAVAFPLKEGQTERELNVWIVFGTEQERTLAIGTIQTLASKIFGKALTEEPQQ